MFNYNINAVNLIKIHYVIHCLMHASSEDIDNGNTLLCHTYIASFPAARCLLVFFHLLLTHAMYTKK